ncbi:hypothetical protein AGMMS49546_25950 [Spirochaetia bacterium]|nr:hypothetical protein AGMMS49546_25950 [Spirochaetia bacterium]
MRIVSWNCCNTLTKDKVSVITEKKPDVLVIQECNRRWEDYLKPNDGRWYGNVSYSQNQGVGVFLFNDCKFTCFPECFPGYRGEYKYVLPFTINSQNTSINIFAVWAKTRDCDNDTPFSYEEQVIEAIKYYHIEKQSIVIGDYNTFAHDANTKYPPLVNCARDTEAGKNTFYSQKGGFGIDDFCFATSDIANNIDVKICQNSEEEWDGDGQKRWRGLSDHCPIIVDFDL